MTDPGIPDEVPREQIERWLRVPPGAATHAVRTVSPHGLARVLLALCVIAIVGLLELGRVSPIVWAIVLIAAAPAACLYWVSLRAPDRQELLADGLGLAVRGADGWREPLPWLDLIAVRRLPGGAWLIFGSREVWVDEATGPSILRAAERLLAQRAARTAAVPDGALSRMASEPPDGERGLSRAEP